MKATPLTFDPRLPAQSLYLEHGTQQRSVDLFSFITNYFLHLQQKVTVISCSVNYIAHSEKYIPINYFSFDGDGVKPWITTACRNKTRPVTVPRFGVKMHLKHQGGESNTSISCESLYQASQTTSLYTLKPSPDRRFAT